MQSNPLYAISSIDGRYHDQTEPLSQYFSEYALVWRRVVVECEYFRALAKAEIFELSREDEDLLQTWIKEFSLQDAERVKEIEKETNHDVKAVEYWLQEKAEGTPLEEKTPWFHFGLTSEDVNSIAYGLMLRDALSDVVYPTLWNVWEGLHVMANEHAATPMLSRTHGQPASPTTFGKEIRVFAERLSRQLKQLQPTEIPVKLGGATGTLAAHQAAFPNIHWNEFADMFVESLNTKEAKTRLVRVFATTQIEPHDRYAELFDCMRRTNTILIDFCQDVWKYISDEWVIQKKNENEVGSSTMPHKVNPIDFENAEGNLGVANALYDHFSNKLPISRLQRDLSDSTVERVFGTAFAHSFIAYNSIQKGLSKLEVDSAQMLTALQEKPEILTEAIQTVLRREGVENAYELLKDLSRGEKITLENLHSFIQTLPVSDEVKAELQKLTPESYIGDAENIARDTTQY